MKKTWGLAVLFAAILCVASCGGSSTPAAAAANEVALTGIVTAPTVSANIAVKGIGSKAVADSAASTSGHVYTLEGEDLGTFTTAADGTFSLNVSLTSLKGTGDSGTSWSEDIILNADNGIQTYAEVSVVEGTTTTVDIGTADTDSTLAAMALANQIPGWAGWGSAYSPPSGLDLPCFFAAQKALWENSALSDGGLSDDNAVIRETMMAYMASGSSYSAAGYTSWGDMIDDVIDGTADDSGTWDDIAGVADDYIADAYDSAITNNYAAATESFGAFTGAFATQFGSTGLGLTALDIGNANAAATGSICDSIRSGTVSAAALVGPMLESDDVSSFATTYTGDGMAVLFGMLDQCAAAGDCSNMTGKPAAIFGFLDAYAGNYDDIYNDGTFDSTALNGAYKAAVSCEGNTADELQDCATAMYGTVYTGAGGNWDGFMTGGSFDDDIFAYYGGYYSTLVEGDTDMSGVNYTDIYTGGQTFADDTSAMDAVKLCIDTIMAAGGNDFSSCYNGYDPTNNDDVGNPQEPEPTGSCTLACMYAINTAGVAMSSLEMCVSGCGVTTCSNFCSVTATCMGATLVTPAACATECLNQCE